MLDERLIAKLRHDESAIFGNGADDIEIARAEELLELSFPASYRQFMQQFGWGGVGDLEIFGLGADVPPFLNVVYLTKSERTEAQPPLQKTLLPICNDGFGNLFCIDTTEWRPNKPVVFWNHEELPDQEAEEVAEDFGVWLQERIISS